MPLLPLAAALACPHCGCVAAAKGDLDWIIMKCLEKTGGNKRQAARLLNLSRTTFIDKLQRLNVASA